MNADPGVSPSGAYGFEIRGIRGAQHLLVRVNAQSPILRISQERAGVENQPGLIARDRADLRLGDRCRLLLERTGGRAVFRSREPISDEAMVHPYLAPAAAVFAWWHGWASFHGGAFARKGEVWALLGEKGAGKSSLLAALASEGCSVVTDDLLMLEGTRVFPGPRTVDLRGEAATFLDVGEAMGQVGSRERWRVPLRSADGNLRLSGWIYLDWGPRLELEAVPAGRRVELLARAQAIPEIAADPAHLLDLVTLPAFVLRRPQTLEALDSCVQRLMELAAELSSTVA